MIPRENVYLWWAVNFLIWVGFCSMAYTVGVGCATVNDGITKLTLLATSLFGIIITGEFLRYLLLGLQPLVSAILWWPHLRSIGWPNNKHGH